jgi:uncharacterized membrane protein
MRNIICPKCDQLCHPTIDVRSALVSWPFTLMIIAAVGYVFRTSSFMKDIYNDALLIYIPLVWLFILTPFFVGFRRGFKLVKAEKTEASYRWLSWCFILLFAVLFGIYTQDWTNIVICFIVFAIVHTVFNYLGASGMKKGNIEQQNDNRKV